MRLALVAEPSDMDNEEGVPLLVLSLPPHLQVHIRAVDTAAPPCIQREFLYPGR